MKKMRKGLIMACMAVLLLCGCQANHESTGASEYYGELSKAQEIAVIPADAEVVETLTQRQEIEAFMTALDMECWELKQLPQTAEPSGTFSFSQEETVKFGESGTDGELYPVCEILCYEEIPYLTLKAAGLKMTFQISDEAAEYLAGYFE